MDKRNISTVGGSSGIGLELAKLLYDDHPEVYAGSRSNERSAQMLISNEDKRQAAAVRHPLRRIGNPQDIARLAAHRLSDSNAWITGQIIQIDGGMSSLRVFR